MGEFSPLMPETNGVELLCPFWCHFGLLNSQVLAARAARKMNEGRNRRVPSSIRGVLLTPALQTDSNRGIFCDGLYSGRERRTNCRASHPRLEEGVHQTAIYVSSLP
jgi:hypothetical protein